MAKQSTPRVDPQRPPRILWANPFCLLDSSSGANISIRAILGQLQANGYKIAILGATTFDSPIGITPLKPLLAEMKAQTGKLVTVDDGRLRHHLLMTGNTFRGKMLPNEEGIWFNSYLSLLDSFKPDLVFFYGGMPLEMMIPYEARLRGIPSLFYLVNGNYKDPRWCQDVSMIITDTMETASMYQQQLGFIPVPVGKFIETEQFVPAEHTRERLLFINPSLAKGASIVVQVALALEQQRPDIQIEVVESRGNWSKLVQHITAALGSPRAELSNVTLTANTTDMRPIYGRARVLLAPSLWWESGARVLAEAMLNAIPAVVSNRGGNPSMIGEGGILIDFPPECYKEPHDHRLSAEEVQGLIDRILPLFDDEALYQDYVERARKVGEQKHHISVSTKRLIQTMAPLLQRRAGDKNYRPKLQKYHEHHLNLSKEQSYSTWMQQFSQVRLNLQDALQKKQASVQSQSDPISLRGTPSAQTPIQQQAPATVQAEQDPASMAKAASSASPSSRDRPGQPPTAEAPEHRLDRAPAAPATAGSVPTAQTDATRAAEEAFDWQIQGKIVVLDNRSKLIKSQDLDTLLETGAFAVVAFDPASEVEAPEQYEVMDDIQLFRHALLGDGQPATLYSCLDPALSGVLKPLPPEQLPEHLRAGAQILAQLPISTIALDSIDGMESLDWLILDPLSDAIAILDHGTKALEKTLLLQARVAFQPTHERQPSLVELQHWAARNGFRFYRFNDASYHSLFPQDSEACQRLASELQSLDALFIPSDERLKTLDDNRKQKLVFLLHTVFSAHDLAYQVMSQVNALLAKQYLRFVEGQEGTCMPAPEAVAPSTPHDTAVSADITDKNSVQQHKILPEPVESKKNKIKVNSNVYSIIDRIKSGQTSTVYRLQGGRVAKHVTGTVPGLFEREKYWLQKLSLSGILPEVYEVDENEKIFVLEDAGSPINKKNCPKDYVLQLENILKKLEGYDCRHNDLSLDEVLVKNGIIKVIDFGWASLKGDYTCGGYIRGPQKIREFEDGDIISLINFYLQDNLQDTELYCLIDWGGKFNFEEDAFSGNFIVVQRFSIEKEIINKLISRNADSFVMKKLTKKGFKKAKNATICIFYSLGYNKSFPCIEHRNEYLIRLNSTNRLLYASEDLAESREMMMLTTFFASGQPYSYWQEWWGKAFFRKELAVAQFQDKRQGMDERWQSIRKFVENKLEDPDNIILDVGSNLGDTVNRLTNLGFKAVGLEYDAALVKESRIRGHADSEFKVAEVNPDYINNLENYDIVLLLSVMHRMWALKSKAFAESCLKEFSKKTNNIYFEGALGLQRYLGNKREIPNFENNSVDGGSIWHKQWLKQNLTEGKWNINYLGVVPHTSSEPYRVLFAATKVDGKVSGLIKKSKPHLQISAKKENKTEYIAFQSKRLRNKQEAIANLGPSLNDFGLELKQLRITSTHAIVKKRDELYETIRKTLTRMLNEFHGVQHSERYWDILLHYFIGYRFIVGYLPRWNNGILNAQPDWDSIIAKFPTRETYEFGSKTYTLIGPGSPYVSVSLARFNKFAQMSTEKSKVVIQKNRDNYNKIAQHFFSSSKGKKFIGIDIGVQDHDYWHSKWLKEGVDIITLPPFSSDSKKSINWNFRSEIAQMDEDNPFPGCEGMWSSLALCLPCEYVEDYPRLVDLSKRLISGKMPTVAISTLMGMTSWRFIAAILAEQDVPLHLQQHGGGYNEFPSHLATRIETRIADVFYTWGWTDASGKAIPAPPSRLEVTASQYQRIPKNKEEIIAFGKIKPLIPVITDGTDLDVKNEDSVVSFANRLSKQDKQRFVYRFRRQQSYSRDREREIIERLPPETKYDFQERSSVEAYARARKVIVEETYGAVPLECERLGIPYDKVNSPSAEFMSIPCYVPEDYSLNFK